MIKKIVFLIVTIGFVSGLCGQEKTRKKTKEFQEVIYKIINNDTLKLRIYYPNEFKKKKKHSTIVFFFGGGWNGGTITQFEDQSKYFASRGMVSVVVDYRVKSRHKTTPYESVKDAKSAMRFLRANAKKYGIHAKKIVASGGSAGGHLAAGTTMLSTLNESIDDLSISPKANALVLYNPVIDNGPTGFQNERMGERYLEISPMHNIRKGVPPSILFLGTKDKHIPVATVEEYKTKLEAVGSRCDLHLYENQLHGFFNKWKPEGEKYYKETTRETDLFLESIGFLKGKPTI